MTVWLCQDAYGRRRLLDKPCGGADSAEGCRWMELHPAGSRVVTADSEHCDECGQTYDDVYLWALIHERAPAGLLCPACALRRVVESSRVVTAEALAQILGSCPECGELPNSGFPDVRRDGLRGIRLACLRHEMAVELADISELDALLDALAQSKDTP